MHYKSKCFPTTNMTMNDWSLRMKSMLRRKVKSKDQPLPSISTKHANDSPIKTFGVLERLSCPRNVSKPRAVLCGLFVVVFLWQRFALYRTLQRSIVWYFVAQSNNPEGALWRGTLVKEQIPSLGNTEISIDLVVSHCNRPLDWIFEWASPLSFNNISVVSKCDEPVLGAPLSSRIIRLPNVGRCDHSYAYFLSENYDQYNDNSDGRYVLFLKDNDNSNRNVVSRHRNLAEMIAISNQSGFACHEEQIWGWSQQQDRGICQLSAYCDWDILSKYARNDYTRLQRDDNANFASKNGDTLGEYAILMGIGAAANKVVPVCFGGNFMAHSRRIQKLPRDLWKRIETSLSRDNNIAEGHFAERLWANMLSRPLERIAIDKILQQHQRHGSCQVEEHMFGVIAK
jgi:hypothetical protein